MKSLGTIAYHFLFIVLIYAAVLIVLDAVNSRRWPDNLNKTSTKKLTEEERLQQQAMLYRHLLKVERERELEQIKIREKIGY